MLLWPGGLVQMDEFRMFIAKIKCRCVVTIVVVLSTGMNPNVLAQETTPALGKRIESTELLQPVQIFADGRGLPEGSGNAVDGAEIYRAQCQNCHGSEGRGGSALELLGDRSLLASEYPDKGINVYWPYAPPLFAYIQQAMPPDRPFSLDANDTYSVLAYLLEQGDLIEQGQSVDANVLSNLKMPNRDGFNSLVPH